MRVAEGQHLRQYVDGLRTNTVAVPASGSWTIYKWGWQSSGSQALDEALRLFFGAFGAASDDAMVRRWHADPFGFLRSWNEVPALFGSAPPATPPSTGTGVVTFLMG